MARKCIFFLVLPGGLILGKYLSKNNKQSLVVQYLFLLIISGTLVSIL
jgi:hypothetical protein